MKEIIILVFILLAIYQYNTATNVTGVLKIMKNDKKTSDYVMEHLDAIKNIEVDGKHLIITHTKDWR